MGNMVSSSNKSSIDLAVQHYSHLFTLPPLKRTLILSCLENFLMGLIASPLNSPLTWLIYGLILGIILNALTIFLDYLTAKTVLKKDIVLNFRRLSFLSFCTNFFYVIFVLVGSILMLKYGNLDLLVRALSIGFFASLSLRSLAIYAISSSNLPDKIISSSLQPLTILLAIILSQAGNLTIRYVTYIIGAAAASMLSVYLFINLLNECGKTTFGIPSLEIFRAFIANWAEDLEGPFEGILEHLGEEHDITVSLLAFRSKNRGNLKSIIVAPNLHPGPFKNIGSSPLPSLIMEALEGEYKCVVSVPHGISGHSLDLVSQKENRRVLEKILRAVKEMRNFSSSVTNFFMVEKDGAKVGCQVFNNCVFLTLTLSPETMEDLPIELNETIAQRALENGFAHAIAIDAHNSLNGPFNVDIAAKILEEAATLALKKARDLPYAQSTLRIGAGKVNLRDVSVRDGIGPGGITAIVVESDRQRTAYITIDGNNMVSGLREKILSSLRGLGISGGEVFTTDTHIVNAVVLNERGYCPVGEAIDHDKIIEYVKCSVIEALNNMEESEVAWCKVMIPRAKVIGEQQINYLSMLVDRALKRAGRSSLIFIFFGILFAIFSTIL
ncbi:MAG: DUF2070 family protein [Candidatus Bathyarchaeia archaeon]